MFHFALPSAFDVSDVPQEPPRPPQNGRERGPGGPRQRQDGPKRRPRGREKIKPVPEGHQEPQKPPKTPPRDGQAAPTRQPRAAGWPDGRETLSGDPSWTIFRPFLVHFWMISHRFFNEFSSHLCHSGVTSAKFWVPAVIAAGVGNPPAPSLREGRQGVFRTECARSGKILPSTGPRVPPHAPPRTTTWRA